MNKRTAYRIGARLWAGLGLLACAAIYFIVAPQVDAAESAQLGQGVVLTQGVLMRFLAVAQALAGVWVLVMARTWPGLTAALAAVIGLSVIPRLSATTSLDLGFVAFDARFLIWTLQVIVIVAGVAVAFFWMTRNIKPRTAAAGRS
ncbi:hypothetical protein HQQ80_10555 [Microbacteriaceae bacterium VKM Ac-2855]|nr:hypothetical protein [Microbacteriaceae bacterium VKM Ac-2855]